MDKALYLQRTARYFFNTEIIIPYYDIGDKFNPNGMIDFFTWEEIKHPIMHGVDITNRYFMVLKLIIDGEKIMETIFQRYCDSEYFLSNGYATSSLLLDTFDGMDKIQFKLISDLINNGQAVIREEHRPNNHSWIGKYVYIYDGKDILIR